MRKYLVVFGLMMVCAVPQMVWAMTEDEMYNAVYEAQAMSMLADLDGATQLCEKVLTEKPDFAPAWATRADIKLFRKDMDGALADAKKAIELDPENQEIALAYYVRATIALDMAAQPNEALEFINKAIDLSYADPQIDYYELRAQIYAQLGNQEAADADLAKVEELKRPE